MSDHLAKMPFHAMTCWLNGSTFGNPLQSFSARTYEALYIENVQGFRRWLWKIAEKLNPFSKGHEGNAYRDELPQKTYGAGAVRFFMPIMNGLILYSILSS